MSYCHFCRAWGRKVTTLVEEHHVVLGDRPTGTITGIHVAGTDPGENLCVDHWTITHDEAMDRMRPK